MLKKRIGGIMLTVCLLATILPVNAEEVFSDIENHMYQEAIMNLYNEGVVKGIGNNEFAPDMPVSNAQALQLFVNAFALNLDTVRFAKEPLATDYFDHADNLAWYAKAMIVASVNGVEADSQLMPSAMMTRETFYHLLITTMEDHFVLPRIKLVPVVIEDESDMVISNQASIQRGISYGIVTLDDESKLNPTGSLTRGEAADALSIALDYLKEMGYLGLEKDLFQTKLNTIVGSDEITFQFDLYNISNEDQTITYNSSQTFDMDIYNSKEEQVYNWASNKSFMMMLQERVIEKNQYQRSETTWDYRDMTGERFPAGIYKVVFNSHFEYQGKPMDLQSYVMVTVAD